MLMFLSMLLLIVIDGLPLMKMHDSMHNSSSLVNQIISSKDDHKLLLSILADADPSKLNDVIALVRSLLVGSETELAALITSSDDADTVYDDAVTAHDTAISTQTSGIAQLATDLAVANAAAQIIHDQGVATLQGVVDVANNAKNTASEAKNTANGVLAAERVRLESEISILTQVIALVEGVIGINTFAPTSSPTAGFQLEQQCTSGRYRDTQYTEAQTPTIEDCETICRNENGCVGFTYGNVANFEGDVSGTPYTSDGGRANDCIMIDAPFDLGRRASGWEATCRWNTYSLTA